MSILLSSKLRISVPGAYLHWCPGCNQMHMFYVDEPAENGAIWSFDGNIEYPSFTPSMHITVGPDGDPNDPEDYVPKKTVCHYFLTNGIIEFLNDCEHNLKGCKIELPKLPKWDT